MHPIVKTLTEKFIDYAGLFPPAKLELENALANFLDYQQHPQGFFLARFVLPLNKTTQAATWLHQNQKALSQKNPMAFSLLTNASTEHTSAFSSLDDFWSSQMLQIQEFLDKTQGLASLDTVEFAICQNTATNLYSLSQTLKSLEKNLHPLLRKRLLEQNAAVFVELPWSLNPKAQVEFFNCVAINCEFGVKLRTGGTKPEDVPELNTLARALNLAGTHRLKLKCTAGLHDPLRHFDSTVGTKLYGFLNVFLAGIGAQLKTLQPDEIKRILSAENATQINVDKDSLKIADIFFSHSEIAEGRKNALLSMGSCSFLEPVEGLQGLGLLN